MTTPDDLQPGLDVLGVLTDPVRRAAYRVVASVGGASIGRDEVAAALRVGRTLAAFHLDKLVDAGLLEVSYARRSGRSGPGAGRPAKLYHRAAGEHAVSVPPRAYRSAAEVLAEAVERAGIDATLYEVARERGRATGASTSPAPELVELLTKQGYEPALAGGRIRLRNCPFHRLAGQFPGIVCGMNLALLQGLLDGARVTDWQCAIEPEAEHCCVAFSKNKDY